MTATFRDDSGETRLSGDLLIGGTAGQVATVQADGTVAPAGAGGFTPVTCVLEAFPLDVHAAAPVACKWTHLFNNPSDFTPLVAIPAGLGLTFAFDGTSETVTTTTAGTWSFTLGVNINQDSAWEGAVYLDSATYAVANCPVPPGGQSVFASLSETVTVPAGYALAPLIDTTHAATANPLGADVYLIVVRLG